MSEHASVCDHPLFNPAWTLPGTGEHSATAVGLVTRTAHLDVTAESLWAIVSDPSTWADWLSVHDHWHSAPAGFAPGRRMTAQTLMLGIANTVEWTVESVVAPGSLVLTGVGHDLKLRLAFTITPDDTGVRFTATAEFVGAQLDDNVIAAIERDGIEQLDISMTRVGALAEAKLVGPARPALRLVYSAPSRSTQPRGRRRVRPYGVPPLRMVQ